MALHPSAQLSSSSSSSSSASTPYSPLPLHRPTLVERAVLSLGAAVGAFADPARGDMVAMLGELTGGPALALLRQRLLADEEGRALLRDRPRVRISRQDCERMARELPDGTLGREYARYMLAHGFSSAERHEVRIAVSWGPDVEGTATTTGGTTTTAGDGGDLEYILQRYREVHDFWHVLSGLPPTVLGETAVKWLEMVQTGLPMAALSALVAPLRLPQHERRLLVRSYAPWAARCGTASRFLLAVRYEDRLAEPLDSVRASLNFEPAPRAR
jgi:ubiquinone biosynthesis protein COQ4